MPDLQIKHIEESGSGSTTEKVPWYLKYAPFLWCCDSHKTQRSLEECKDPLFEESAVLLTAWTMSLGRKEGKIVRLAVLYERID